LPQLIVELPAGPLDIVGDVHGEAQALRQLLAALGYERDGAHPAGRRLVFVGDLCDRGPDSPGVVDMVRRLVDAGRATCLLGNHELNLLRLEKKDGNGWFFPSELHEDQAKAHYAGCAALPAGERKAVIRFLSQLPLVAARDDLRAVHACWDEVAIEQLVRAGHDSALDAYAHGESITLAGLRDSGLERQSEAEFEPFKMAIRDRAAKVPMLPAFARREETYQNGNAVRLLTSGPERIAAAPFWASAKWRMLDRVRWWETYDDPVPVVFGHYWRRPGSLAPMEHKGLVEMFPGSGEETWFGPRGQAFCVDFCVGMRHIERAKGVTSFGSRLAALRWPERDLVTDLHDAVGQ
jgi:hypothetical protein